MGSVLEVHHYRSVFRPQSSIKAIFFHPGQLPRTELVSMSLQEDDDNSVHMVIVVPK